MNTALIAIGSAFAGIALGYIAASLQWLPQLNDAERRIDNLLTWDDEQNVRLAEIEMYQRNRKGY